jgi:uncharacterized delta-60 repeat protein
MKRSISDGADYSRLIFLAFLWLAVGAVAPARAQQSGYSAAVQSTPGALGYWPFSAATQANSAVGGITGAFQGNAVLGPVDSGALPGDPAGNTAVLLDGNASFVSTNLIGGIPGRGSIAAWFKLTALPSSAGRIFTIAGSSQVGNDFDLQIDTDNRIRFYTDGGSSTVIDSALTAADLGVWHFVVATFTANAARSLYLDGHLAASSAPGGHNASGNGNFAMGESQVFRGRFFQGALDEVAVFNRELSAAEAANLYAARLIPSVVFGQVVPDFDPGAGVTDGVVRAAAFQPDGKPVIAGSFTNVAGAPRSGVARLNPDGTLDAGFNPGAGADDTVNAVLILPDGRILIGGDFTSYDGTQRNGLARLNADGSLDLTFNAQLKGPKAVSRAESDHSNPRFMRRGVGINAPGLVSTLSLQANGQVIFGGSFNKVAGVVASAIARLNADGSMDASFKSGGGPNGKVRASAPQPDGKTIIGGDFNQVGNAVRNGLARLLADGSVDPAFDPGAGAQGGAVNAVAVQPDGAIIVGGEFTGFNNAARRGIARVQADARVDASFNPGAGADGVVRAVALQSDGKTLIGGSFGKIAEAVAAGLARLNINGSVDAGFQQGADTNGGVFALALRADGAALAAGEFTTLKGSVRNRVGLVNTGAAAAVLKAPVLPIVTASVGSGADAGNIFLQRAGDASADLIVRYKAGGTAAPGRQYQTLSGTKKIKAGKATAKIKIRPLSDGAASGASKVSVKVQADAAYTVGDPAKAKAPVIDPD